MSDALDYLLKARPDAMRSYFSFLREAGGSLDPKTRAIISVITKVDNQTAAGFRQYLKRALKEGVTAAEIIDALLMAFPTLGLSKMLWAIDLVLEMDLPEFRLDDGAGQEWRDLADVNDLPDKQVTCIEKNGKLIFVYRDGDILDAYNDICPHRGNRFKRDSLSGCTLVCPGHQWQFDLTTGEHMGKSGQHLQQLETRVHDNRLAVKL